MHIPLGTFNLRLIIARKRLAFWLLESKQMTVCGNNIYLQAIKHRLVTSTYTPKRYLVVPIQKHLVHHICSYMIYKRNYRYNHNQDNILTSLL